MLGQAGHGALKGVGVQVGGSGSQAIERGTGQVGGDGGDAARGMIHGDIPGPAVGQKGCFGVKSGHAAP